MVVARDEWDIFARRERQEVIVGRILRSHGGRRLGIGNRLGRFREQREKALSVSSGDSRAYLRLAQRPYELAQEFGADDKLELALRPELEQASRRAAPREQRRDKDIDVQDDTHALRAPRIMLRLDGDARRLVLVKFGRLPDPLEQVEPEVAPKRFFYDVAVSAPGPRGLDPHRTEDTLIERHSCTQLRHKRIIAS
jgi:hypothetical protein